MRNLTLALVAFALVLCGGCAIAPTYISAETQHVSHVTQHFGADKTEYGYNTVGLNAHWDLPARVYLDVSEAVNVSPQTCDQGEGVSCHGALEGPRETFNARIGVKLWEK
jgi:hypothetical protein